MTGPDRLLKPLLVALQFLTTIPISLASAPEPIDYELSTGWFPFVGLLVGIPGALIALSLSPHLPGALVALLMLTFPVVITGALHLDGFADCCDAMFAPRQRRDRLAILKDSRVGVFGAVGLVFLVLIRFEALTLTPPRVLPAIALTAPCLGRWAMVLSLRFVPPALPGKGLGSLFPSGQGNGPFAAATLIAVLAAFASFGMFGVFLLVGAAIVAAMVGLLAVRKLGGATGDVYGATSECAELLLQLGCAVAIVWR